MFKYFILYQTWLSITFSEVFSTLMSFNSIMLSAGNALHLNAVEEDLKTLQSQRDSLHPYSAIDKYSISHPDSFLQQIVDVGEGGETGSETETVKGMAIASLAYAWTPSWRRGTPLPFPCTTFKPPSISTSHPHQSIFTHTHARTHRCIPPPSPKISSKAQHTSFSPLHPPTLYCLGRDNGTMHLVFHTGNVHVYIADTYPNKNIDVIPHNCQPTVFFKF